MLCVTINGRPREFADGISILDALRSIDIEVPTLCHDDRLKPYGGCRLCIVQVEGWPHPVTACNTMLVDGMSIMTHSQEIETLRRTLLKLLSHNYPADAAQKFPDKQFHRYVREYGLEDELRGKCDPELVDDNHPYIHIDMSQCIHCQRCVRICDEVQGQFVWNAWNRGDATRIRPGSDMTLQESSCVSCGACVDTCPTGALEDKSILLRGMPSVWTKTVCPYCGTGCEMDVGTLDNRIVSVKPTTGAPVNNGHLCVKGRYAFDFVHSKERVTDPMIREDGIWKLVSWDEAISYTAEKMAKIIEHHGPDSIAVLGSARATNEENYLTQKFARVALGTNNVDCCARVCHAPTAAAMKLMLGAGAATNSYDDIEQAHTILVCGANPTENHPIVGARIKQAAIKGANLIVIDPRQVELAGYAECHLQLKPGTNVPLLNAMASVIVTENLCDKEFLKDRVSDYEEFVDFIRQYTPERASRICGVDADLIRKAARRYAKAKPAMSIHGLGVTEHTQGTEGVMCLVNLALLTGNIGKPGAGVNPLRGQNNVQGSAHMGCDPGSLTGGTSIDQGQDQFESVWKIPLPTTKGLNLLEMMDAARQGKLKGLWTIGYDIFLTNANAHATEEALASIELVVVQDMFLNETAKRFGTVFFPASSSFEKDGTFMNSERRIQKIRKAIEPVGQSRPDWEIICDLAKALGKGEFFDFASPKDIWDEVRSVWQAGYGITYERIESTGLQWPCPSKEHPGTSILHTQSFPIGKRSTLRRIEFTPTKESTDKEFPFSLTTGRTLYQFNAGTMTMNTDNVALRPTDYLDISREDAQRLSIYDGDQVFVKSRYGEVMIPVRINASVKIGELFATFHDPEVFLNYVTSPRRDNLVQSPEYKVTAVQIQKL